MKKARHGAAKKFIKHTPGLDPAKRQDAKTAHVIISEKKDKKAVKYLAKDVPYPYTSAAQYEQSLRQPTGVEWTTRTTHQRLTMPKLTKKVSARSFLSRVRIDPLTLPPVSAILCPADGRDHRTDHADVLIVRLLPLGPISLLLFLIHDSVTCLPNLTPDDDASVPSSVVEEILPSAECYP